MKMNHEETKDTKKEQEMSSYSSRLRPPDVREVENLPHIRRPEPRKTSTKNLFRYLRMPSCPTFSAGNFGTDGKTCSKQKRLSPSVCSVFSVCSGISLKLFSTFSFP